MDKIREETARLNVREILLEKLKEFTLLSDVFLTVALRDRAACQHVLRLLTGKEDLTVKEVRTQYRMCWRRMRKNVCIIWRSSAGIR